MFIKKTKMDNNKINVQRIGDNVFYIPPVFDNGEKANTTVYSDRLYQWDSKKHDKLCKKHFGNESQIWSNRDSKKTEEFLRDYFEDDNIVLCKIQQTENKSTGYPLWRFDYKK